MKASLVAYNFRELHKKVRAKNNKIGAYQRLSKNTNDPNWVAQKFRG
jgi:hypothetical protein